MSEKDNINIVVKMLPRADLGLANNPAGFKEDVDKWEPEYAVMAVTAEKELAGYIMLCTIGDDSLRSEYVKTMPGFEELGVATKMYEFLIRHGERDIYAYVAKSNEASMAAHRKNGFIIVKNEDRVTFIKYLKADDDMRTSLNLICHKTESHILKRTKAPREIDDMGNC